MELVKRTKDTLPSVLVTNSSNHKSCYAATTNISKLERARKRYRDSIDSSEASLIKRMAGRPRLQVPEQQQEPLITRSKSEKFDKKVCIFYEIPTEENLTRAEHEDTGKRMLLVSDKLSKSFFRRLNSIPKAYDAVANDVVYHDICWIKAKREAAPKTVLTKNFVKTLSDIKLINFIELRFSTKLQGMIEMNEINRIYKSILLENGMENEELSENYKKALRIVKN